MLTRTLIVFALPIAMGASCSTTSPRTGSNNPTIADASVPTDTGGASKIVGWSTAIKGPGIPEGQSEKGYAISKDAAVSYSGHPSVTIQSTAADNNEWRCLTQGIRATDYRGKRIRLTGYVRTRDVSRFGGIWMQVDAVDRQQVYGRGGKEGAGTTDWTQYSVVLDVAKDSDTIFFGASLLGTGQIWLADLKLEVVDPTTVTTTGSWFGPDYSRDSETGRNLDFTQISGKNPLKIPGWRPTTEKWDKRVYLDRDHLRNGKPTATLFGEETGFHQTSIYQEILAAPYRGKRVQFQAYIKTTDKVAGGTFMAIPGGGQWAQVAIPLFVERDNNWVPDTREWKPVSAVLDIPQWANCIQFGVDLNGPGQLWASDATFRVVDPNKVPVTYAPTGSRIYNNSDLHKLNGSPVNLDFAK